MIDQSMFIEGIKVEDVAILTTKVIEAGEHSVSSDEDIFMSTSVTKLGTTIRYEHLGGPVHTRHTLRGARWSFWMELRNATITVTDGTDTTVKQFLLKTRMGVYVRYLNNRFHMLHDLEFRGEAYDFHNDMLVMKMAGLI